MRFIIARIWHAIDVLRGIKSGENTGIERVSGQAEPEEMPEPGELVGYDDYHPPSWKR